MSGTANRHMPVLVLCAILAACGQTPSNRQQTADEIAARMAANDLVAADEMIRSAIARWPDDPRLRELQGDLDLKRGHGVRAQTAYEKALIRAPARRVLKVKLARALISQNRYREALAVAQAEPGDPAEIRARFSLVRLEAGLALGSADFRAQREEAEALWRLAESPGSGSDMQELRRRLEEAARRWEPVEAGRQHAECRPETRSARSAESDVALGKLIRVGPAERLKDPAAAAAEARDGAVIEIEVGSYDSGPVIWTQDNLTIRGRQGRPRLRLGATASAGGAIWVMRGKRAVVENVEFIGGGAGGPAAIRLERGNLTVRGGVFRGAGIVATGGDPKAEVLVTGSELSGSESGAPGGRSTTTAIDIGPIGKLTLEFSYLHGPRWAPDVMSRAAVTRINYNRVSHAEGANARSLIELPDGGRAEIVGNELEKGPAPLPSSFVSYGAAGRDTGPAGALYVLSNTFHNATPGATGVNVRAAARVLIANNVFAGAAMAATFGGTAREAGNQTIGDGPAGFGAEDFALTRNSSAIDAAVDVRALDAEAPPVEFEYRHPMSGVARADVWKPDAGAHEFCGAGVVPAPAPAAEFALPGG